MVGGPAAHPLRDGVLEGLIAVVPPGQLLGGPIVGGLDGGLQPVEVGTGSVVKPEVSGSEMVKVIPVGRGPEGG